MSKARGPIRAIFDGTPWAETETWVMRYGHECHKAGAAAERERIEDILIKEISGLRSVFRGAEAIEFCRVLELIKAPSGDADSSLSAPVQD